MLNWRIYVKINSFKKLLVKLIFENYKTHHCKRRKFPYFSAVQDSKSIPYICKFIHYNHIGLQEFLKNFARDFTKFRYIWEFGTSVFVLNEFYCTQIYTFLKINLSIHILLCNSWPATSNITLWIINVHVNVNFSYHEWNMNEGLLF